MKKYRLLFVCLSLSWGVYCSPSSTGDDVQLLSNKYARIAKEVGYDKAMEMQRQEIERLKSYSFRVGTGKRAEDGNIVMELVPKKYVGVRLNRQGEFELYDTRNQ
jgi:hypothetical protein